MRSIAAATFLLTCAFGAHAQQQNVRVERVVVVEKGVYSTETVEKKSAQGTITGQVDIVREIKHLSNTTVIPANVGTEMGLRYRIVGSPQGAPIQLRVVFRLPKQGMVNPKTGVTHFKEEAWYDRKVGFVYYDGYLIGANAVPVTWVFEFWYNGQMLGEQTFTVVKQ